MPFAAPIPQPALRRAPPLLLLAAISGLALLAACSGYRFGNRSLYRPDIRTVSVPVFESDSYRRYLGERLTEAVVKEIELKTPFKVVDAASADSTLTGRIVSEHKHKVAENQFGEPRALDLQFNVQLTWTDRRGGSLISGRSLPVPGSALNISQTAGLVPEVGQSITSAQQVAIDRLAVQIVSQLEMAW